MTPAEWTSISSWLASNGAAGVIGILLGAFSVLASGKVRLEREINVEIERRKVAESERDSYKHTLDELREQRDREREQKLRTLELLNASMQGRWDVPKPSGERD